MTDTRQRPAVAVKVKDPDSRQNKPAGDQIGRFEVAERPLRDASDEDDDDEEDTNSAIGKEVLKTLDKLVTTKSLRLQRVTRLVEATREAALKKVSRRNQVCLLAENERKCVNRLASV
jgi:hypothetical protein